MGEVNFHCRIQIVLPPDMPSEEVTTLYTAERRRGLELLKSGKLVHIWRIKGERANISLYHVRDRAELTACLASLPLFPYMQIDVTELEVHPLLA